MIRTDIFFTDIENVMATFSASDEPRARKMLTELDKIAEDLPKLVGRCAVYKGRLYALLGENGEALAAYDRALSSNCRDPDALLRRGDLHRDAGRYSASLADYERALELAPDSVNIYIHRGEAHGKAGNNGKAREDYERALELEPRSEAIASRLRSLL